MAGFVKAEYLRIGQKAFYGNKKDTDEPPYKVVLVRIEEIGPTKTLVTFLFPYRGSLRLQKAGSVAWVKKENLWEYKESN